MRYTTLPLNRLKRDARNLRSRLFEPSLKDLAASLNQHGQLYPVLVIPAGEDFAVMDGFRRVEAARTLNWPEITVGIIEENDADELQIAYVGNFQREGINYIDEANWLAAVLSNTELDIDRLAAGLNRSEAYIRSRLEIPNWPKPLLDYTSTVEISFSVAREYARLGSGKDLENALIYDRSTNPSARQAAAYVAAVLSNRAVKNGAVAVDESNQPAAKVTELTCDACKNHPDDNFLAYGGYCLNCLASAPSAYTTLVQIQQKAQT